MFCLCYISHFVSNSMQLFSWGDFLKSCTQLLFEILTWRAFHLVVIFWGYSQYVVFICTSRWENEWDIWNWWDTYVPAAVICYPSFYALWWTLPLLDCLLCWPQGTSPQTPFSSVLPWHFIFLRMSSVRTNFEGLFYFLSCLSISHNTW